MSRRSLTVVVLLLVANVAAGSQLHAQAAPQPGEAEIVTAPVEIDGVTLFRLRRSRHSRRKSGPVSSPERLTAVAEASDGGGRFDPCGRQPRG